MTVQAQLADGRVLEFPDGTAPEVVQATVKKMVQPPEQSITQKIAGGINTAVGMTPQGLAAKGADVLNQAVERGAYKAGGAVTDATGSPAVGYATNVAIQAVPAVLGGMAAKGVASPALQQTARNWMQSALKPSWEALRTGKAAKAIDTMFEEGINVSEGGVEKLKSKINELNAQIAEAIRNSPATVDKSKVGQELLGTLDRLKKQVNPQADIESVKKAWINFRDHPLLTGRKDIPVQLAQEMKQGTYQALGGKSYGELKGADITAQKDLARGLKNEIAAAVPEVGPLNAVESKMLNALSLTERRMLMDANKNPAGLGWLARSPEMFAAFVADRSPLFKSIVARMIKANSGTVPVAVGATVGGNTGASSGSAPSEN